MNEKSCTLGVDLGGTSIRVGLYSDEVVLLGSHSMPTRVAAGPQACVEQTGDAVRSLLRRFDCPHEAVLGMGIGSPGPINLNTGVLGLLPNLPGWDNFPLRDAMQQETGLEVILESDANAAAIAEWKMGAGREHGLDSMAMLTLGTGVGSGLILNGRVWHGMFGMGGEVGHTTIHPEGPMCGCGTRGCLEMYASANALLRLAREIATTDAGTSALRALVGAAGGCTPLQVAALATEQRDAGAMLAYERLGHALGIGVANLLTTLDLPMVVIGGGLAAAWPLFALAMFESVRQHSVVYRLVEPAQQHTLEHHRTFIRPAMLGAAAGLMGAALLPSLAVPQPANAAILPSEIFQ